jgi:hypothetical protein
MARRAKDPFRKKRPTKERNLTRQEQIVHDLKLRAHSGLIDGPRWGFTASKLGKSDTCVHRALFSARAFFNAMVGDDDWDWVDDEIGTRGIIETSSGIKIVGHLATLEKIVAYKMKPKEAEYWECSAEEFSRIAYIRSDREYIAPEEPTYKKRHSRRGMIKAGAVAEQLGISPRELRSKLRRSKIEKPEHGWAWRTQDEVDALIEELTGEKPKIRVNFKGVQEPS